MSKSAGSGEDGSPPRKKARFAAPPMLGNIGRQPATRNIQKILVMEAALMREILAKEAALMEQFSLMATKLAAKSTPQTALSNRYAEPKTAAEIAAKEVRKTAHIAKVTEAQKAAIGQPLAPSKRKREAAVERSERGTMGMLSEAMAAVTTALSPAEGAPRRRHRRGLGAALSATAAPSTTTAAISTERSYSPPPRVHGKDGRKGR